VVRALASHQCGRGWIFGVDSICGLRFLLLSSLLRVLRVLRFFPSPSQRVGIKQINISQFQMDLDKLDEEAVRVR